MNKTVNYNGKEYKKKCQSVREQLHNKGIRYALYECIVKDRRATICIAKLPSGEYVRGCAVCSTEDNFCRAVGNFHSMVRVLQACKHKLSKAMVKLGTPKVTWNSWPTSEEVELLENREVMHMEGCK